MKKLFPAISAILCIVILTMSFSAATDAYALYRRSAKKMDSITSFEMQTTNKFYYSMYGTEFTAAKQTFVVKAIIDGDGDLQLEAHSTDKDNPVDIYYYKGYAYRNTNGRKLRVKMSMNDALRTTADIDWNMAREQFDDARVEKVEGGQRIHYTTDINDLLKLEGETIDSIMRSSGAPPNINVDISNIKNTLTIDKDDIQRGFASTYVMVISDRDSDKSMKFRYNSSGRINSVNTVKQINYPNDLATYTAAKSF